jgi:hypothetical protein
VRIHPIRDGLEQHPLPVCEAAAVPPCPPQKRGRKLEPGECRNLSTNKLANADVNRVLLQRALAGVLTRLRSFDWQVIHGHQVGGSEKRGTSLDVHA